MTRITPDSPGRRFAALAVLLGATAVLTAGAAQAGSAAHRTWKVEPTPNPAAADISVLSSVACTSRRACTAVGSSARSLSSPTVPVAERWNGKRWHIQRIPAPPGSSDTLYGVSCPAAHDCVAVGSAYYKLGRRQIPLVEAWNGRRWRVQSTPAITSPSSLYAVSCPSRSSCIAVGYLLTAPDHAIVERWDGRTWRTDPLPQLAGSTQLFGVSCPKLRACTAVGNQNDGSARPLAESWDGARWHLQAVPAPRAALLDAVSCTSPAACIATGTNLATGGRTLAERWDGKTWRVYPTPNPADLALSFGTVQLNGVSCVSPVACNATGEYSPHGAPAYFLESWNGSRWRLETTPHAAGDARGNLLGIACTRARCTAVGAGPSRTRLQATLAIAG